MIILGRDDAHALRFFEDSAYTNCQFTEDLAAKLSLEDRVREILRTSMQSQSRPYMRRVQESMILWGEEADVPLQEEELVDLNHQGIIHLHPQEMRNAAELMENMLTEQTVRTPEFRRVKELLQTTRKSIAEIAAAVGIHDQNYYARLFKKMIGCSPSYYKSV